MVTTAVRIKRGFCDTPDGQVHYLMAGSGEPILLLHQTISSSHEYDEMMPILAQTNWVIAMDTMGYGDSDHPARQYFIPDYARAVVHLLDNLGIGKITIGAHHTGTYIAAEVAAAYPERVDKLVLSGHFNMDAAERERNIGTWPQWEPKADGSFLLEMWQRRMASTGDINLAMRGVLDVLKAGNIGEYGHWAVIAWPQEERLPLIQCPTLLVWGIKDLEALDRRGWHATQDRHKVGEAIRRCKEVSLPEGTGAIPRQMPEVFSKLIVEFMKSPGV